LHIENPKKSKCPCTQIFELINNSEGYRIQIQYFKLNYVSIYTSNKQPKDGIKKRIPVIVAFKEQNRNKCNKISKDLYIKNETLLQETEDL
jgi:hypothetical protein